MSRGHPGVFDLGALGVSGGEGEGFVMFIVRSVHSTHCGCQQAGRMMGVTAMAGLVHVSWNTGE